MMIEQENSPEYQALIDEHEAAHQDGVLRTIATFVRLFFPEARVFCDGPKMREVWVRRKWWRIWEPLVRRVEYPGPLDVNALLPHGCEKPDKETFAALAEALKADLPVGLLVNLRVMAADAG